MSISNTCHRFKSKLSRIIIRTPTLVTHLTIYFYGAFLSRVYFFLIQTKNRNCILLSSSDRSRWHVHGVGKGVTNRLQLNITAATCRLLYTRFSRKTIDICNDLKKKNDNKKAGHTSHQRLATVPDKPLNRRAVNLKSTVSYSLLERDK